MGDFCKCSTDLHFLIQVYGSMRNDLLHLEDMSGKCSLTSILTHVKMFLESYKYMMTYNGILMMINYLKCRASSFKSHNVTFTYRIHVTNSKI